MQTQNPEKQDKYLRTLTPRLSRYPPGCWVPISDVARDAQDFIDTVQQLVNGGHFTDEAGYCIIDIKEDTFVRLDPEYLRLIKPGFRIWK